MSARWDGITRAESLLGGAVRIRHEVADAAKRYDWPELLALLSANPALINATRPGGHALYTPLHQAAHGNAPVEVVERLVAMSAWRTLRNAQGETPRDVALWRGHGRLLEVLTPVYQHDVPLGRLAAMQAHLHAVIRERVEELVTRHALRLPELEPLLEMEEAAMWFAVPGMYGGFNITLEGSGEKAHLVSESWCRVVGGSGERHEIDAEGSRLVAVGFV
ncbi:ankyrin repeat domain-containing protein [Chondromyces crocatus]|uniref:Uncharacterized protein n=1 Tax=Chondromyces crocatus TaxID=52 RepID=A0A0K1ESC7_CHOCO|nr:ankyrin repeat domain-containing protein [Chondromyces crocatus]AKT43766.1 uncharacterized protein CMC5_080020 [Chondromyces crocatus]